MAKIIQAAVFAAALSISGSLSAKEIPVGPKHKVSGMEIGAVYLQPIEMEPPGMMREAKDSDMHLEADIKAEKDNANGFATGDWVPYLVVSYELMKDGDTAIIKGDRKSVV